MQPKCSSLWGLLGGVVFLVLCTSVWAWRPPEPGPVRFKDQIQTAVGKRSLFMHDVGAVRMTLSNWGEQGNPDGVPGYIGFEFPAGSGNDFLFSSGIWVGAIVNGVKLVSTGTDGDNGTNEFAPSLPIGPAPFQNSYFPVSATSDFVSGRPHVRGAKGVDDDGDGRIDEDPAGDISNDFIDNDGDGKVDMDDDDFDGDAVPGSLDDDGDGKEDEDGNARGFQEYFTVYDDRDITQVQSPDPDGHTPLNIQVLQRTYAWGEAYASQFILVDLVVRNVGDLPLTNVYLALFADPDIVAKGESGDQGSADDGNFYDAENLMMVQYDDPNDADGVGPGLFAMKVVRTPAHLDSLKLSFSNFDRLTGGDPERNVDKYDMISSGNIMPETPNRGDWRFLLGFGPREGQWVLRPGDELPVTVAFIAGYTLEDLRRAAQWAQRIYDNDFQGPQAPDQPIFWTESHPDRIRIFWRNNAEKSRDPITLEYDFEGYQIQRSLDANTWLTLAQFDVINDDTLFEPEFRRINFNLGMPYDLLPPELEGRVGWYVDTTRTPRDTVYWLDDVDVLRGWTYHYIVRAFDRGVSGAGVLITPIGQSYRTVQAGYTSNTWSSGQSVADVFVVPNPYKGSHELERGGYVSGGVQTYPRKLFFMNLPPSGATIHIFTLAGDHIITLHHHGPTDQLMWDMRNKYQQEVVSGVYYFIAESGGDTKIDKFVILK